MTNCQTVKENMEYKNTKKKGDAGVGVAIAHYTKRGNTVAIPITDSQDYDLIVEDMDGLQKVQVKTTKSGEVGLRILGGNSGTVQKLGTDLIYDILFAVCDDGSTYEIPKEVFANNRNSISVKSPQYESFQIHQGGG